MKTVLVIIGVLYTVGCMAQTPSSQNWEILGKLTYKKSADEYGEIHVPDFGEEIRNLEGKQVELSGYIIPFEGMFSPDHLIISSVPVASCFFCGGAGPESVAEVYLEESVKYTVKKVTVIGKLVLNEDDVDQLMYILKDATLKTD